MFYVLNVSGEILDQATVKDNLWAHTQPGTRIEEHHFNIMTLIGDKITNGSHVEVDKIGTERNRIRVGKERAEKMKLDIRSKLINGQPLTPQEADWFMENR